MKYRPRRKPPPAPSSHALTYPNVSASRASQNGNGNSISTLFRTPNPRFSIAARFRAGNGGENVTSPRFKTPRGTVTTAASAANTRPSLATTRTYPSDASSVSSSSSSFSVTPFRA